MVHYFWIVFTVTRLMQPKEFVVILLTRLPEQNSGFHGCLMASFQLIKPYYSSLNGSSMIIAVHG